MYTVVTIVVSDENLGKISQERELCTIFKRLQFVRGICICNVVNNEDLWYCSNKSLYIGSGRNSVSCHVTNQADMGLGQN